MVPVRTRLVTRRAPRRARPVTRLAIVGLVAHVSYELVCGVAVPLAAEAGIGAATTAWAAATTVLYRGAGRRPASSDALYAVVNTLGVAAVVAHLAAWPRRRTVIGLPVLIECEGLGQDRIGAYNAILYFGGSAALAALLTENRTAPRATLLAFGA